MKCETCKRIWIKVSMKCEKILIFVLYLDAQTEESSLSSPSQYPVLIVSVLHFTGDVSR